MTTATRRTGDPPAKQPRRDISFAPDPVLARVQVMTMQAFAQRHPELCAKLCESPGEVAFDPRFFSRWEQLLHACERVDGGVVLLDLDDAERSPTLGELGISAHRLAELLAQAAMRKLSAFVVLTARDYAEIEDLMRSGVHALLHPQHDAAALAEQVRAAWKRRRAGQMAGRDEPCGEAGEGRAFDTVTQTRRLAPHAQVAFPDLTVPPDAISDTLADAAAKSSAGSAS